MGVREWESESGSLRVGVCEWESERGRWQEL